MYGYVASMRAKPGQRDAVMEILLSAAEGLKAVGCRLYVVGAAHDDVDVIWVSEAWDSREHHDASLELPETREAIGRAMPMLTGEFTRQELTLLGGLGL